MSRPPKESWNKRVTAAIYKLFAVIQDILDIIKKIVLQTIRTVVTFFTYVLEIAINPSSPAFVAITVLVVVSLVAVYQWGQVGIWLGSLLGLPSFWGWGAATLGIAIGAAINITQLSPELWKINDNLAIAYQKIGVDPEFEGDDNNLNERVKNKHSFNHQLARKARIVSYAIEGGLVLSEVFFTGLTLPALVIAAISLIAPELAIKYVYATTHTLRVATEIAMQQEFGESGGGSFAKGGSGGKGGRPDFDGMPMGGGKPPGRNLEL